MLRSKRSDPLGPNGPVGPVDPVVPSSNQVTTWVEMESYAVGLDRRRTNVLRTAVVVRKKIRIRK